MRKKPKLNEKQKKTLKKMKLQRQLDSNNLRQLIIEKKKWTINEIRRGQQQIQAIQKTLYNLEGILLFINDLIEPIEKEEKK
jgi:hypothetical protein